MLCSVQPSRPRAFLAVGGFFLFGALMAAFAALTLLQPGTFLDRAWGLNPIAHRQLAAVGPLVGLPFLLLSAALLLAGIGWCKRRLWGWWLGTVIIAINLAGDLVHALRGEWLKGASGILLAGLLLSYITSSRIRSYFLR